MRVSILLVLPLLGLHFSAGALSSQQQPTWLPPQVEAGVVDQLVGRLDAKGLGEDQSGRRIGAQQLVRGLVGQLEKLGENGVLEAAPGLAGLSLPAKGQKHLDAMLRYHICNMALLLQHEDPALDNDENARSTAVVGLSAVAMAVIFLRQPLLEAGGTQDQIETALTSDTLAPLLQDLQTDQETRDLVDTSCGKSLEVLLGFLRGQ